jgi:hypothetical protein
MRLDWAIPCMSVSFDAGLITSMEGAAWTELWVPEIPAPIEFVALLRAVGMPEEFAEDAQRDMEARLSGPGMEELVAVPFELPSGERGPDHPAGWEGNALVPLVVQFTAQQAGTYTVDFYLNGRYQQGRSIPFRIIVGTPSPGPA